MTVKIVQTGQSLCPRAPFAIFMGLSLLFSLIACNDEEETGGETNTSGTALSDQGGLAKSDDRGAGDLSVPCEEEEGPIRLLNLQNDSDNLYAW